MILLLDETEEDGETLFREVYEFDWEGGRTRSTDNLQGDPGREAVEHLAELGREDPECTVSVQGYESIGQ